MVPILYAAVDPRLYPAASGSVFSHLIHMVKQGVVACDGPPRADSRYRLA